MKLHSPAAHLLLWCDWVPNRPLTGTRYWSMARRLRIPALGDQCPRSSLQSVMCQRVSWQMNIPASISQDNFERLCALSPRVPQRKGLHLSTVIMNLLTNLFVGFLLFSISLPQSSTDVSRGLFPNILLTFRSLSQGQFLGKLNLRQVVFNILKKSAVLTFFLPSRYS